MAVNLSPVGGVAAQFLDNNGNVLTGGKIYTYASGTTTPQAVFTSAAGTTAHSNPIILDASGRVPSGEIWLTDGSQYKFVIKTADEVTIGTYENIIGINSNFVNFTTSEEVQIATAGQTVFTLTTMQYAPGTNNLVVYVDGVNQVEGGSYSFVETSSTVVTFTSGLHVGAVVKFVSAELLSTGVVDSGSVVYQPAGTGAVATNVQAKLRETVSVKDFGAVGDGVTDDTAAIQLAVNQWLVDNKSRELIFPPGEYRITNTILFSPALDIIEQKTLTGYGAKIINQSATIAFRFVTTINQKYWANAVVEGLTISGGVNCFSFEGGGPANQDWMYQFTLKNLNAFSFSGNGFYCYDGFFESAFYSCAAWANPSNVTGFGFKFEDGPASIISSIDIYNANTRYGLNGIRTVSPVSDVDIFGGTFILAYEEGIRLELAIGSVLSGVHVEENWQKGSGVDTIRAGIRYSGSASLVGIHSQSGNANKQNYGVRLFSTGSSFLSSCHAGGAGHTAFGNYASGSGANDWVFSMGTTYVSAGGQIADPKTISGTYLPVLTGVTNIASSSAATCQYLRSGNAVTVSGFVSVVTTLGGGAASEIRISLPFASNFASGNQCAGTAVYYGPSTASSTYGMIRADQTNDDALLQFHSNVVSPGTMTIYFTFTYLVV